MSFWKHLETAINIAAAAHTINEGNKWINQKKVEIANENTRENALIDIAYTVGLMNNDEWKIFINGLRLKAIDDAGANQIAKYCDQVVQIEINELQQLLGMDGHRAATILTNIIDRNPLERCIYMGLLLAKKRDVNAAYLLNNVVDNMNRQLYQSTGKIASGKINSMSVEHNIYHNNKLGMYIHLDLTIHHAMNRDCSAVAWFYYADGTVLRDIDNSYRTSNGQVATYEDFRPNYESTNFSDLRLFMPYSEFDLRAAGLYHLKFKVGLFCGVDQLDTSDFNFIDYRIN
jgi:hypothetical protein